MRQHPAQMAAVELAAMLLAGCSGTSGNRSQLSRNEGLLLSTRNLLQPTPLPLPRELDEPGRCRATSSSRATCC